MKQSDLGKWLDPTVGVGKQATPHSAANKPEVMVPLCLLPGLHPQLSPTFYIFFPDEKEKDGENLRQVPKL